jgi:RND family efflux transporter MFP subunit
VKKGDLLARLESPETDQQVLGARADVQLKTVQAERARKLRPQGFIAQQDLDNAESGLRISRATLQQLLALQSYEQVRAPFDGVVTARYVDPGALVAAGTASNQAVQPLFDLADMRTVRVQVYVGQDDATDIHPDSPGEHLLAGRPRPPHRGKGHPQGAGHRRAHPHHAGGDGRSQRAGAAVPGSYVNVKIRFPGKAHPVVPGEALAWRGDSLYVAKLDTDSRIRLVKIQTRRG